VPVSKGSKRKKTVRRHWAPPKWRDMLVASVLASMSLISVSSLAIGWWQRSEIQHTFSEAAARGRSGLSRVETLPETESKQLAPDETYEYKDALPTSGPFDRYRPKNGFYRDEIRTRLLVSALKYGNVVIYYDFPGPETLNTLRRWTGIFDRDWGGIVVVPKSGLGAAVVLTAWDKRLRLDPFDPAAAAAFIDEFRGRGNARP
jgi:hypothetical protein